MLYAFIAHDAAGSGAIRPKVRPHHLAYLQPLLDQGRVVFAGPHPAIDSPDPGPAGYTGSLIIAEFESLAAARAWSAQDPYVLEGVFGDVDIKPILQVRP
ncbi:MAG TPA: YciI family protein [Gammaproteobacteria bacterium]|nr:YciI family protein [Gammaproteobacteria bacterium]